MKQVNLPLATSTWDESEYRAIDRVVQKGFFSMSDEVRQFESDFAEQFNTRFSVMVNSGSSANLLMVAALFFVNDPKLRLKKGDEVIVPAVSWSTTYFPLQQYGLKLKFVDIDLNTLNICTESLADAITDQTKLIFLVNLLGNPNEYNEITKIIAGRDIIILEDNCESMGAKNSGYYAGTYGLMGSFSCYFSHHISTMEGGVICTDDEQLYHILLSLRSHGWTRHLPNDNHVTGRKGDDSFSESFNFVLPGYNVRPLELSGAIGQEQLKKLPDIIEGRRTNAGYFTEIMNNSKLFQIQREVGESSWFGFSLILKSGSREVSRDEVLKELSLRDIEFRPIVAGNFTKNPVMRYIDHVIHGELNNAEHIHQNGLFIGNHHYDIRTKLDALIEVENSLLQ